jgi:hypothetical protein
MGGGNTKLSKSEMKDLRTKTEFSEKELEEWLGCLSLIKISL